MSRAGVRRKKPIECVCCICGVIYTEVRYASRATCSEACKRALIAKKRAMQPDKPDVWHDVPCPVCGRITRQNGKQYSNQRKTCSPECHDILRARIGKEALARHWDTTEAAMREGAQLSPNTARNSEEHHSSKEWFLRAPDGTEHHVWNLAALIRELEGEISHEAFMRWEAGLSRLRPESKCKRKSYHGWVWVGPQSGEVEKVRRHRVAQ